MDESNDRSTELGMDRARDAIADAMSDEDSVQGVVLRLIGMRKEIERNLDEVYQLISEPQLPTMPVKDSTESSKATLNLPGIYLPMIAEKESVVLGKAYLVISSVRASVYNGHWVKEHWGKGNKVYGPVPMEEIRKED